METISVTAIFFVVIITTLIVSKIVRKMLDNFFKKTHHHPEQFSFIKHLISGLIYILGIGTAFSFLPYFKNISASLFAGSGVLAIIIGFASQQTFANLVSGVFIVIFQPFKVGDMITLLGKEASGFIEDITLRHTVIRTFENKRIIIPNSIIGEEMIENTDYMEQKICKFFEIGISYDSDMDKAIKIIEEEVMNHKDFYDNRTILEKTNEEVPPVTVKVIGFGESSVNLKCWVWAKDYLTGIKYVWDLNYSVKKRFDQEGIEIPFPYRTLVFKNNLSVEKEEEKRL